MKKKRQAMGIGCCLCTSVLVIALLFAQIPPSHHNYVPQPGTNEIPLEPCLTEVEVAEFGYYASPPVQQELVFEAIYLNVSVLVNAINAMIVRDVYNRPQTRLIMGSQELVKKTPEELNHFSRIRNGTSHASLVNFDRNEGYQWYLNYYGQSLGVVEISQLTGVWGRPGLYISQQAQVDNPAILVNTFESLSNQNVFDSLPAYGSISTGISPFYGTLYCNPQNQPYCNEKGEFIPAVCKGDPSQCKLLIGRFPEDDEGTMETIIETMGWKLVMVYLGEEYEGILSPLLQENRILLVAAWSPGSDLLTKNPGKLVRIQLPTPNKNCIFNVRLNSRTVGKSRSCDFVETPLRKHVSATLRQTAPEVAEFIDKFSFGNDELTKTLSALVIDGKSISSVACDWIKSSKAVWSNAIARRGAQRTISFNIAHSFPLTGVASAVVGNGVLRGLNTGRYTFAKDNAGSDVIFSPIDRVSDTRASPFVGVHNELKGLRTSLQISKPRFAFAYGAFNSFVTMELIQLYRALGVPFLSPLAASGALSNTERFPNYCRVNILAQSYVVRTAHLVSHFKWTSINVVATDDSFGKDILARLTTLADTEKKFSIELSHFIPFGLPDPSVIDPFLERLKTSQTRVVYLSMIYPEAMTFLRRMAYYNLTGEDGLQIIGTDAWTVREYPEGETQGLHPVMNGILSVVTQSSAFGTPRYLQGVRDYIELYNVTVREAYDFIGVYSYSGNDNPEALQANNFFDRGYDMAYMSFLALRMAIKAVEQVGFSADCMFAYEQHTPSVRNCRLTDEVRSDYLAKASCTGVYNTTGCIKRLGVINSFTDPLTAYNPRNILLYAMHEIEYTGMFGLTKFDGNCDNGEIDAFYLMNIKVVNSPNSARQGGWKSKSNGTWVVNSDIVGRIHLNGTINVTKEIYFSGGTIENPRLSPTASPILPLDIPKCRHIDYHYSDTRGGNSIAKDKHLLGYVFTVIAGVVCLASSFILMFYTLAHYSYFEETFKVISTVEYDILNSSNSAMLAIYLLEHCQLISLLFIARPMWMGDWTRVFLVISIAGLYAPVAEYIWISVSLMLILFGGTVLFYANFHYRWDDFVLVSYLMRHLRVFMWTITTVFCTPIIFSCFQPFGCVYSHTESPTAVEWLDCFSVRECWTQVHWTRIGVSTFCVLTYLLTTIPTVASWALLDKKLTLGPLPSGSVIFVYFKTVNVFVAVYAGFQPDVYYPIYIAVLLLQLLFITFRPLSASKAGNILIKTGYVSAIATGTWACLINNFVDEERKPLIALLITVWVLIECGGFFYIYHVKKYVRRAIETEQEKEKTDTKHQVHQLLLKSAMRPSILKRFASRKHSVEQLVGSCEEWEPKVAWEVLDSVVSAYLMQNSTFIWHEAPNAEELHPLEPTKQDAVIISSLLDSRSPLVLSLFCQIFPYPSSYNQTCGQSDSRKTETFYILLLSLARGEMSNIDPNPTELSGTATSK
eukprot:Nk52_evm27s233 gene=Nk52_evmTU27s233